MNAEYITQQRSKHDALLITGGAERSPSGQLTVTLAQIESARIEMASTLDARRIISGMDQPTFLAFATELQYANRYHAAIADSAQTNMIFNDVRPVWERYADEKDRAQDRKDEIIHSPLYGFVRDEANKRFGMDLSDRWTGWLGINPTDRDNISSALSMFVAQHMLSLTDKTYLDCEQPIVEGRLSKATDTLAHYGIQGTFVGQDDQGELLIAFHRRWNSVFYPPSG